MGIRNADSWQKNGEAEICRIRCSFSCDRLSCQSAARRCSRPGVERIVLLSPRSDAPTDGRAGPRMNPCLAGIRGSALPSVVILAPLTLKSAVGTGAIIRHAPDRGASRRSRQPLRRQIVNGCERPEPASFSCQTRKSIYYYRYYRKKGDFRENLTFSCIRNGHPAEQGRPRRSLVHFLTRLAAATQVGWAFLPVWIVTGRNAHPTRCAHGARMIGSETLTTAIPWRFRDLDVSWCVDLHVILL